MNARLLHNPLSIDNYIPILDLRPTSIENWIPTLCWSSACTRAGPCRWHSLRLKFLLVLLLKGILAELGSLVDEGKMKYRRQIKFDLSLVGHKATHIYGVPRWNTIVSGGSRIWP